MDLDCMSDSSCGYDDLDSPDSVFAADTGCVLNNFENLSSKFCEDVAFEMPTTNQISYPNAPTLIKVPAGNSYKYLLLQPSPVQSSNSENTNPNAAVLVDVTDKVILVPPGNPPFHTTNNIPAPLVQQNAQAVPKKAPKRSACAAKIRNQTSNVKEVKTTAVLSENLKHLTRQNNGFLPKPKQMPQELLVKPLQEQFSNHIHSNQGVVQASEEPAGFAYDVNFVPPVQEHIEIACSEQPAKSIDYSPPIQDSMGVDFDLLFQAWDDNSQQAGINPTVVHENVEAVYEETEDSTNSPLPTAVNKRSTTTSRKKRQLKKEPKNIATLVFFDLETTGLPYTVGTSNVQVTEVSMIAVDRGEFCKSQSSELKDWRIVHKLSMVVKPRSYIDPVAASITGLDDIMLKDQEIFDENTAKAVVCFLSHLTKPACLLAHNGKRFDFPLLKAELKRHAMDFPDELYVADTLLGLRAVDVGKLPSTPKTPKSIKRNKDGKLSMTLENLHIFFFNGKHQGGHSAEGDCVALAKVCHKTKDEIIPWMDENCVSGDTVMPMW